MLKQHKSTTLLYSLIGLTVISGAILLSTTVRADDSVVDVVNITVPVSCTMSGTGMNTHNAEIQNGTYQANIGTTTLKAFCNDNNGFAIYAAGYTGNEIGATNSNKLVGTSASNNATIVTGTATSTPNPDVSNWAMKLTATSDSGDTSGTNALTIDSDTEGSFSGYHTVPNEYTKVAHKNTATSMDTSSGGATLTTTYAAYISKTQPADTYSGQVIYTLVHPASAQPSQVTPPTSCPTRVPGLTYMQDLTSVNKASILSGMTEDAEYYLADKRDDKTYCVAKLKDGNLWMTQNLDHDIVTDGSVTYDNTTTDLGWNGSSYSTAIWTPSAATKATNDTTWDISDNGHAILASYDPGDLYWNGTTTSIYNDNQISSIGNSHYHLGNYYNWTAAVAMNNSSSYTAYIDVNQSICPVNWTLPKTLSVSSGSFRYLFEQYGWSSNQMTNPYIWSSPIKLSLSGRWYGSQDYVGYKGGFWSSVVYNSRVSYPAEIKYDGYVYPDGESPTLFGNNRNTGFTVRCVAR